MFVNVVVNELACWACVFTQRWELLEDQVVGLGLPGYDMFPQVVGGNVLDGVGSDSALRSCWMGTERTAMVGDTIR